VVCKLFPQEARPEGGLGQVWRASPSKPLACPKQNGRARLGAMLSRLLCNDFMLATSPRKHAGLPKDRLLVSHESVASLEMVKPKKLREPRSWFNAESAGVSALHMLSRWSCTNAMLARSPRKHGTRRATSGKPPNHRVALSAPYTSPGNEVPAAACLAAHSASAARHDG
jgi:hypothetical protein